MSAHNASAIAQPQAFAKAIQCVLEAVMFENWLRFYFITEKPAAPGAKDKENRLFIAVPEQGMERIKTQYSHLLPLAASLNGQEITFEASRSAVCTFVVTEIDGKQVPQDMATTVFDSSTFQIEMQLFNTWVQAHEEQLDARFLDFGMWRSLFAQWRSTDEVQEWAAQMRAVPQGDVVPEQETLQ